MEDTIKVSIICNTFNQVSYIKQALDSFLNQKTSFAYEILVHDDASTDGTTEIVREYASNYPDIVKAMIQTENQYSKGVSITDIQLERAKGKYIAFCEGDDYWKDPLKLEKQYHILETHPDIDMVAHAVECINDKTSKVEKVIQPSTKEGILTPEAVIYGGGGFIGTNALFFRKEVLWPTPKLRKILCQDYTMQILGALKGGIYYLPEVMSVYRLFAKNSWTGTINHNVERLVNNYERIIKMLRVLDEDTNGKYKDIIQKTIKTYQFTLLEVNCDLKTMRSPEYKDLYKQLKTLRKLKIFIKKYLRLLTGNRNI